MLASCSTSEESRRAIPPNKSCEEILPRIAFRDQFFTALRGKGSFESKAFDASADVELAVVASHKARLELTGPLGIRYGMLLVNDDWVQFYVPRENSVSRFPKSELYKDTVRRERFLKLVPLPVVPEAFFQGLLTQVGGMPKEMKGNLPGVFCEVDREVRAYRIRFPGNSISEHGGRWIWVEGESFYPVKILYFERNLPIRFEPAQVRPSFEVRFAKFSGQGASTLPKRMELLVSGKTEMTFEWNSTERWESPDPAVFEWRPAASMDVKDY